jgi:hypothetical protein
MSSRGSRHARAKALVLQDQGINETEFKEFRMHLEESLFAWERRRRTIPRVFWTACGVLITDLLAILVIEGNPAWRSSELARVVWGALGVGSFVVAAGCLVWYNDKYVPSLRHIRFDLQMSMIRELQQQVETLHQEVSRLRD